MLGLRSARVRWGTALRWIAAMAYGSRFCDLFDRVELLLMHSEAKKLGLPCLLVSYKPLANYIFGGARTAHPPVCSATCRHT